MCITRKIPYVIKLLVVYHRAPFLDPFSDGRNLFIPDYNIENLFKTMNKELRKVTTWFKATSFPWIFSKQNIIYIIVQEKNGIPNILPPLLIDHVPIKGEITKFLGALLDENISCKYQIIVSTKICKNTLRIRILAVY